LCFVLFKSFFDANTAREFLQNSSNFKDSEKNNFTAKWFKNEDEKDFSDSFKSKIQLIVQKYNENNLKQIQQSMNNNNNMLNAQQPNKYNFYPQNWQQNQINMSNMLMNDQNMGYGGNHNMNMNNNNSNKSKNSNVQQYNGIYGNMMGSGNLGANNQNFNVSLANGRKNSSNSTADEDRKNQQQQNGKFTCRFEMQIENDKEFQVARRLIGAKVNFYLKFS